MALRVQAQLLGLLDHNSVEIRVRAVNVFELICSHIDWKIRRDRFIDDRYRPRFVKLLDDPDIRVQRVAPELLAYFPGEDVTLRLIGVLSREDKLLRVVTLRTLSSFQRSDNYLRSISLDKLEIVVGLLNDSLEGRLTADKQATFMYSVELIYNWLLSKTPVAVGGLGFATVKEIQKYLPRKVTKFIPIFIAAADVALRKKATPRSAIKTLGMLAIGYPEKSEDVIPFLLLGFKDNDEFHPDAGAWGPPSTDVSRLSVEALKRIGKTNPVRVLREIKGILLAKNPLILASVLDVAFFTVRDSPESIGVCVDELVKSCKIVNRLNDAAQKKKLRYELGVIFSFAETDCPDKLTNDAKRSLEQIKENSEIAQNIARYIHVWKNGVPE